MPKTRNVTTVRVTLTYEFEYDRPIAGCIEQAIEDFNDTIHDVGWYGRDSLEITAFLSQKTEEPCQ